MVQLGEDREVRGRVTTRRGRTRRRRVRWVVAALAFIVIVVTAAVVLTRTPLTRRSSSCTAKVPGGVARLELAQAANAATIATVGKRLGMADHAVTVALAAALQESQLHNLPGGDRDSVGLFQQRPSQGWGTMDQLLEPTYAASAFYRALAKIPGWTDLSVTDAAQRVQRSDAPGAYARWESEARVLARVLTGEEPAGLSCQFDTRGLTTAGSGLDAALQSEVGSPALGSTVTPARGWTVASWLVGHAHDYGISAVSFAGRQWTASSGKWQLAPEAGMQVQARLVQPAA
ncbi:MAG TPA: hypothetical protein VIB48_10970 [Acidimicrobiia bacterium]